MSQTAGYEKEKSNQNDWPCSRLAFKQVSAQAGGRFLDAYLALIVCVWWWGYSTVLPLNGNVEVEGWGWWWGCKFSLSQGKAD